MEGIKCFLERRSIRKYTSEHINDELIKKLLTAGMYAPSAGNEQPWEYIVVRNKELLVEITKVHPYSSMLKEADAAIIVCGNLKKEKFKDFWVQDCSASTQNILLAAHTQGLGAVWLGVYPENKRVKGIKKIFNLPKHIIPLSIISLGYPSENKPTPIRFNEDIIHYDEW